MDENKVQEKYSLTKRIVSLTIFLDSLFLIIVVVFGLFVFSVNAEQLKENYIKTETKAVLFSTDNFLFDLERNADILSQSSDVIAYLEYINEGNNPVINEGDLNRPLFEKIMLLMNNVVDQQEGLYSNLFIASSENCLSGDDGCFITHDALVYDSTDGWAISESNWFNDLESQNNVLTKPYLDQFSDKTIITYVQKIYDLTNSEIGYIGIDIDIDVLSQSIDNILTDDNNDILILSNQGNEVNFVYFTDNSYRDYLMAPVDEFLSIDIESGHEDGGIYQVIEAYDEQNIVETSAFAKNYLITYNEVEEFNWQVIVMVGDTQAVSYEILLIIALFIVGILLFFISIILNKSLKKTLKPIHDIINSIEEIKSGNYQVKIEVQENNEIKEIADAINLMSREIDRQVKLVYDNFAYDQLTGLKNRSAVEREINQKYLKGDQKTAVCLLQVDNLKNIIILKGQVMGDNLIEEIAKEIISIIGTDDFLFSNGGNELLYIMPNFNNLSEVKDRVNKIVYRFNSPIVLNDIKTEIKIYVGIATYPNDDSDLDGLIKKCDVSIYKDKNSEKKQMIFYNHKISEEISYQAQVSEQLAKALENREIFLNYQPLIDNKSEIYGFEALARWSSPILGSISPEVFISNAEENYLIIPIGTWILEEACRMQVALRKEFNKEFMMSVNVSFLQILQSDYVNVVKKIIKETDINPKYLTLELTESIFIKSTIELDDKIDDLHRMGVKFSMDDFGTGYASLTYLRKIAFDNLKIDKSFIDGILGAKKENRIVGTIVKLVHNLNMKVIAEGVEHKSQYEYLKQISTDIFQGFFLSKPLDKDETFEFVDQFYKVARNKRIDVLAMKKD